MAGGNDQTPPPPPSKYEPFTDYYLHPSEGSQLVICPVLLTVDNYEEWSRSIRNNLRSKSKLRFVDGSIVQPDLKHPVFRQWGIVNSTVVAWIYNTLDVSIRSTFSIPDDAKTLWDDLRDRYSLGNGPRIFELKHDIADCKQRGRSVAVYYVYLGLEPKKFGSVVSTLLMSDPLPSMNAAYAKVVADERKHSVSEAHETSSSSTTVGFNATGTASGRTFERIECTYCKRSGHDKDHCYQLHGFPGGGRGGSGGRSSGKGKGEFAGAAGNSRGNNEPVSDSDRGSVPTITDAQWKELMSTVKGAKSGSSLDGNILVRIIPLIGSLTLELQIICVDHSLRNLIGAGVQYDGVYIFRPVLARNLQANKVVISDASLLWHRRLGHPSMQVVSSLPGVSSSHNSHSVCSFDCDICFMGKQPRNSFPLTMNKTSGIFYLVHCDIWGPNKIVSSSDARYFLTIVDDFSRATWVFLMVGKYQASQLVREFCAMKGILQQTSCVDTTQQNGRVERKHRHILNVARALRFQAKLPKYFWGECVMTAVHLINRTATPVLKGKTPHELLFGQLPSYDSLRVFGCLDYAANRPWVKDKFDSRSRKCIFVGLCCEPSLASL
ncbi:uncharacterized protein LOC110694595 [Chenopodium quinoa]|uniref:uncharacterized protein LOC110694595 n=1 Tax=Chenopodium quinoa TaxID=63459 RepID=UPI000B783ED1|nr:uncharacterized protein LOC110694595 [Chenopodium quinoa]